MNGAAARKNQSGHDARRSERIATGTALSLNAADEIGPEQAGKP